MTTPAGSLQRKVTKAVLRGANGGQLEFEYNPTEISISHNDEGLSDSMGESKGDARSIVSSIATRGATRLVMSSLTFTGEGVQDKVALLLTWVVEDTVKQADGALQKGRRERLRFQWGSKGIGFDYEVELMRFDCTYTRFARNGLPIRVEIRNLTLHVLSHTGDTAGSIGGSGSALTPSASGNTPAGLPPGMELDHNADPTRRLLGKRSP